MTSGPMPVISSANTSARPSSRNAKSAPANGSHSMRHAGTEPRKTSGAITSTSANAASATAPAVHALARLALGDSAHNASAPANGSRATTGSEADTADEPYARAARDAPSLTAPAARSIRLVCAASGATSGQRRRACAGFTRGSTRQPAVQRPWVNCSHALIR